MKTNWTRQHMNLFLGVECYRAVDKNWYVRNIRTGDINGPHKSLRAAKVAAYEVV